MQKLKIGQFLIKKTITNPKDLVSKPNLYITSFEDNYNEFISHIKNNYDSYIKDGILTLDGGITMNYYHQEVWGIEYWDDLPTLWSYIVNVVEDYLVEGEGVCYFPSQPIEIRLFKTQGNKAQFSIDNNSFETEKGIFLTTLLNKAELFFSTLIKELNLSKYQYEINQIKKIRLMF